MYIIVYYIFSPNCWFECLMYCKSPTPCSLTQDDGFASTPPFLSSNNRKSGNPQGAANQLDIHRMLLYIGVTPTPFHPLTTQPRVFRDWQTKTISNVWIVLISIFIYFWAIFQLWTFFFVQFYLFSILTL